MRRTQPAYAEDLFGVWPTRIFVAGIVAYVLVTIFVGG